MLQRKDKHACVPSLSQSQGVHQRQMCLCARSLFVSEGQSLFSEPMDRVESRHPGKGGLITENFNGTELRWSLKEIYPKLFDYMF